ncbi:MAG: sodium/proton antiporter, NhaA family [Thermoleophilia bacterium]|nr:sodium/proton antiporter, NhaA family [Thermoleophilia bacterium]
MGTPVCSAGMSDPASQQPDDTSDFGRFLRTETFGGVILLVAAALALAWANSPWSSAYLDLRAWSFGPESLHLHLSAGDWARDGLLALFFFVVGLELKRELVVGELANLRAAAFPVLAAIGGIIVPAGIAVAIMWGAPGSGRAWAIPTATDIAFALGVLALAGAAMPTAGRLVLLALAVVDDLVAIMLIAVLFSDGIDVMALAAFVALVALYALLQRARISSFLVYVPLALATWALLHASGVHATIAGVALGLLTRVRADSGEVEAPAVRLEHRLQPWSAAVAVPIFAFFAAGVPLDGAALRGIFDDRIAIGIIVALVVGKLVGIIGASWIAERAGWGSRPEGVTWPMVGSIGLLGGIGFTVSLLVADLALDGAAGERATAAVLIGSAISTILAVVALRLHGRSATTSKRGA